MTVYIILGSALGLTLICCAWLADQLQKCEKALAKAKEEKAEAKEALAKAEYEVAETKKALAEEKALKLILPRQEIKTIPRKIQKIAATFTDSFGYPRQFVEQELLAKLSQALRDFWIIEKLPHGSWEIEYRATVYVCEQESYQ